jgi:transcription antitermination factor NusG
MPDLQWIVCRAELNRAAVAYRFLDLGGHLYYAPRARIRSRVYYRGRMVERAPVTLLFADYLFVQCHDWGPVRRTFGIHSVVMRGEAPAIVPPAIIAGLRAREDQNGLVELVPDMRKGTRVQITQGPFAHYEGVLAADPTLRVKVLLDCVMMGAAREVSFPPAAVTAI